MAAGIVTRQRRISISQKQSLAFADDMSAAARLCFVSWEIMSWITDRTWKERPHLQRLLHPDASEE